MQLFFQENCQPPEIKFDADESKHLTKVLRKNTGDHVSVTNGEGELFDCVISKADPKGSTLSVLKTTQIPADDFYIHLAIAPTKSPDRMEWMIEKITEIGFHELSLIQTSNSERSFLKTDRLHKKIISACKQSLKYRIPKLNPIRSLKELIESNKQPENQRFIAYVDENHQNHFMDVAKAKGNYLILIGPEGDFSTEEIHMATKEKFIPVSLGRSRLRTETAGLVAVDILQLLNR
jgi:16S rRNA (uracil1498-N3)-methyltransferase